MKKYLIVLAAALVALASCNKTNENDLTGISFKEKEVAGLIGDTLRLALVATPAEATLPADIVWASTDTDVVQVVDKKGNIALVGSGLANVTATSGDLKAICQVKVYTYEEGWAPSTSAYILDDMSQDPVSDTIITYETSKATYTCMLYSATLLFLSNIDIPGGDPGEGDWIFAPAVVPVIVSHTEREDGESFVGQVWDCAFRIVPDDEVNNTEYGAWAGEIDPQITGAAWQGLFEEVDALPEDGKLTAEMLKAFSDAYWPGVFGVYVKDAIIEGNQIYSSYWADAVVTAGYLQTLYNEDNELYADYQLLVQWCDGYIPGFGYCGLQTDLQNAESYSQILVQPYALNLVPYIYKTGEVGKEYVPSNSAPRKVAAAKKHNRADMVKIGTVKKLELAKYKIAALDK